MPIDQSKLDALKSLASGGSPGLDAYRQAQQAEQATRTDALKGALGGQDVYAAAQKAQAQYAPNVGRNPFADAANLQPAANQFLNAGAEKLANQAYEAQQNLTLEAEGLRRAQQGKYQKEMLQGAADVYGQKQREDLTGKGIQDVQSKRTALQNLQALQQTQGLQDPALYAQQEAALKQQLGLAPDQAVDVAALQAGIDQQAKQAFGTYAGALGRDTKGLEEAYASGDNQRLADLMNYLAPEAEKRGREVDLEGNKRLRELAPAFGIDPLAAAGMFRRAEGITSGLKQAQTEAAGEQYVSGEPTAKEAKAARAQQDADIAGQLGFESSTDYTKLRSKAKMSDEEIVGALQSPTWQEVTGIYQSAVTGEIPGGYAGFQNSVRDYVNGLAKPEGMDDKQWKAEKAKVITLANTYYKDPTKTAAGSDESEVE